LRTTGEMVAVRVTVPLKPFSPVMVMVKLVVEPLDTDCDVGLAVIVKSGGGGGAVTSTKTVVE
jgi:hypothetical protein